MNLFIDTVNGRLVYLLERDNKVIDLFLSSPTKKISDEALSDLKKFLLKNHQSLAKIQAFYVTNGPGSYSGIRVGLTIVKTIKAIAPKTKVFLISCLFFQTGLEKGISLIDARGQKHFFAVYDQGKIIVEPQLLTTTQANEKALEWEKKGYRPFRDYENIDYAKNFLELKNRFYETKNITEIEPLYLKSYL